MPNPPRYRKRVRPPCRAADGSAFMKCEECGVSVAIALMDMHECFSEKDVKKLKVNSKPWIPSIPSTPLIPSTPPIPSTPKKNNIPEPLGSPFVYFMKSYTESCKGGAFIENNREAYEKWKNMSTTDRWPYILEARKAENAYLEVIHEEESQLYREEDDEADSRRCI